MKERQETASHFIRETRRALISVFRKEEIDVSTIAKRLVAMGFSIYSSLGTAKYLREFVPVTDVAEVTGMEPILDHRVVTLHPKVHGGLLARDSDAHRTELKKHDIPWFDLVIVDLYPLAEKIQNGTATDDEIRELVDIGGPTMLSAAAKGQRIVIADMADCEKVLTWMEADYPDKEEMLRWLEAKADFVVSAYRMLSARYFSRGEFEGWHAIRASKHKAENGWQGEAGFYHRVGNDDPFAITNFKLVEGATLSGNNLVEIGDRALETATHIGAAYQMNYSRVPLIALGIKHGNPCGAAVGSESISVLKNMVEGDSLALFGGTVFVNFEMGGAEAKVLLRHKTEGDIKRILDVVVAPSFTPEAVEMLARKYGRCRILVNEALAGNGLASLDVTPRHRYLRGGDAVIQQNYTNVLELKDPRLTWSEEKWPDSVKQDLLLAWAVASTSNSNTISLVRDGKLLGNAVGQQSRVGSAKLAVERARAAGNSLEQAVACSDSFFPALDGPQVLADAGVKFLFTTTGSVKDKDVMELLHSRGVSIVSGSDADFRMFFGH